MKPVINPLRARPRMVVAVLLGVAAGGLLPAGTQWVTRWLTGWNAGVWTYLVLMAWMMSRADHRHLHRVARAQADGAAVVLSLVVGAAVASVTALVLELARIKQTGATHAVPHLALAASTVIGAWLLLAVVFTLSYASHYHRVGPQADGGLKFPDADSNFEPHYSDFLYFSFTIAVAAQTADVVVTNRGMRRLVLAQSVLSFGFNAAILSMAINIASGLF